MAAQRAAPGYAVVVDTFVSGDTPDVRYHINDAVDTVRVLAELCRTMGGAIQTIADVWA